MNQGVPVAAVNAVNKRHSSNKTHKGVIVMSVLKCDVKLSDGSVVVCDGIAHAGKLWIIPGWIPHPKEPVASPKRIIRFDCFPHRVAKGQSTHYQDIKLPIPESALLGPLPKEIECIEQPANIAVTIEELRKQYL